MRKVWITIGLATAALLLAAAVGRGVDGQPARGVVRPAAVERAKNVIFFVGDGMGISTVTAARIYSVGVAGDLTIDQFPYTALSRTYGTDAITADSAPTMSAMITGVNTNAGVISLDETTEPLDFNRDGDGRAPRTLLEDAREAGMAVGVVTTARVTHATPAATYAHINDRDNESAIALQALPTDATYNRRLGRGLDLLLGGGRQFFVPAGVDDEEGGSGSRMDGRDLRAEFRAAGYSYIWNSAGFHALTSSQLPVLGLFERGHMEYEHDRPSDGGGEPSLSEMTTKAIDLLEAAGRRGRRQGYFLMVEGGRIDHAHHEGNAFRALTDAEALDKAIGAAVRKVNPRDTLIVVSADHSHVFTIAGYPMRPRAELPYRITGWDPGFDSAAGHGVLGVVYDLVDGGRVEATTDGNGVPYTVLGYMNGPGFRGRKRVDPRADPFPGRSGVAPAGPAHEAYLQESTVPLAAETHGGEDVAIYAVGPGASLVHGTVKNTYIHHVIQTALGLGRAGTGQ